MKHNWNTTKLISAGSLGALLLVLHLGGATINLITGNVAIGGGLNSIITSVLIVITSLTLNLFGANTIVLGIYGVLSIPFNLIGPPGFILKVIIAILGGVIVDFFYIIFRKNLLVSVLMIGGIFQIYLGWTLVLANRFFNIPGFQLVVQNAIIPLIIGSLLVGAIGGYLGLIIYWKINKTSLMNRVQK